MLIKEDIHLFEVDGVMKCVEQRLFQVIREVCGQEAVRITDRCIIQVLEEGEEERAGDALVVPAAGRRVWRLSRECAVRAAAGADGRCDGCGA